MTVGLFVNERLQLSIRKMSNETGRPSETNVTSDNCSTTPNTDGVSNWRKMLEDMQREIRKVQELPPITFTTTTVTNTIVPSTHRSNYVQSSLDIHQKYRFRKSEEMVRKARSSFENKKSSSNEILSETTPKAEVSSSLVRLKDLVDSIKAEKAKTEKETANKTLNVIPSVVIEPEPETEKEIETDNIEPKVSETRSTPIDIVLEEELIPLKNNNDSSLKIESKVIIESPRTTITIEEPVISDVIPNNNEPENIPVLKVQDPKSRTEVNKKRNTDWRTELKNRDKAKEMKLMETFVEGIPEYKEPERKIKPVVDWREQLKDRKVENPLNKWKELDAKNNQRIGPTFKKVVKPRILPSKPESTTTKDPEFPFGQRLKRKPKTLPDTPIKNKKKTMTKIINFVAITVSVTINETDRDHHPEMNVIDSKKDPSIAEDKGLNSIVDAEIGTEIIAENSIKDDISHSHPNVDGTESERDHQSVAKDENLNPIVNAEIIEENSVKDDISRSNKFLLPDTIEICSDKTDSISIPVSDRSLDATIIPSLPKIKSQPFSDITVKPFKFSDSPRNVVTDSLFLNSFYMGRACNHKRSDEVRKMAVEEIRRTRASDMISQVLNKKVAEEKSFARNRVYPGVYCTR